MNDKILSVSIASYNVESFIRDTVSSLLVDESWLKKLEIIIVNDGSKDDTSIIAHEYEKLYPESIVVIDKPNGGYGSTINASLAVAKGKYYKLLDGDDWFDTDIIKEFLQYLEKSDSDLAITPYYEVRETDTLVDNHPEIPSEGCLINEINIQNKLFAMHEIAIKTNKLFKIGKAVTEHCFYTDSEFVFYCILASETIGRFGKGVYRYRLGVEGQSVSIEGIRKHYKDMKSVAEAIYRSYHEFADSYSGTKKEELDYCVRNITYHTYRAYFLINDSSKRPELLSFDNIIKKNYRNIYEISNESNLVKVLRLLHFRPHKVISRILIKEYLSDVDN